MSKKLLALLALVGLALSCQKELLEESPNPQREQPNNQEEFLVFDNRSSLDQAVSGEVSSDLRGISIQGFRNGESLKNGLRSVTNTTQSEVYEELVPEAEFRTLLNSRGEIQVGDTVYCIAKAGTFFAHRKHLAELRSTVLNYVEQENSNPSSLFINLGDITLYRTFEGVDFDSLEPTQDDEEDVEAEELRSTEEDKYKDLDFSKFPRERASRQTWFGKLLQSTVIRKSLTAVYPNHSKRRFNCAVFDYNYLIRKSIGVTAKIQKKMWYGGWAVIKNIDEGDIIVGCRQAVIKMPYPNPMKHVVNMIDKAPNSDLGNSYAKQLPYPEWFSHELINVTIPVIHKNVNVTLGDAIKIAGDRVKTMFRSAARAPRPFEYNYIDRYISDEEADVIIKRFKIDEFMPVTVPIYAKDGIYLYILNNWAKNKRNDAERTMRFYDFIFEWNLEYTTDPNKPQFNLRNLLKNLKPKYSISVDLKTMTPYLNDISIGNNSLNLKIKSPSTDRDLIEGEFYAAGRFHGAWTGYNLYW